MTVTTADDILSWLIVFFKSVYLTIQRHVRGKIGYQKMQGEQLCRIKQKSAQNMQ